MNLKLKISQRHAAAEALKIKSRQFITICRAERITCLQQATVDRINARQASPGTPSSAIICRA